MVTIKATFDEAGLPTGFYNPKRHASIPTGAIDITAEQRDELLSLPGYRRYDFETGTVVPYTPPPPSLDKLKTDRLNDLDKAYAAAITQPVSYMGTTFQADPASVELMNRAINVYTAAGSVPEGFWWLDAENNKVPMTLAQLQGLGQAVADRVWTSFQHLQNLKDAVRDPDLTDPEDLAAIVW